MFGSLTVYDGMAQILGRIFRVPVNDKPITILELTGLPTEIVNVVVSVLCRMTFDFALWSEGKVPVTLVCEEAHRYVPANPTLGFEPCKRAIAKIAKEGRKYGASLCIVTQRPAEIDPTILSQCNTVFALRMSNDRDQAIVQSAISDTGSGLLEFLPALGQREAIAFGDGVAAAGPHQVRRAAEARACRASSTARFTEKWQKSVGDESFLEQVVERWRASGAGAGGDATQQMAMFAEAMGISPSEADITAALAPIAASQNAVAAPDERPMLRQRELPPQQPAVRTGSRLTSAGSLTQAQNRPAAGSMLRREHRLPHAAAPAPAPARPAASLRREPAAATTQEPAGAGSLQSLRDRLLQRSR